MHIHWIVATIFALSLIGCGTIETAMPKGREAGVPYARQFIERAKSEGLVKTAIDRVAMRGAVVAPLE